MAEFRFFSVDMYLWISAFVLLLSSPSSTLKSFYPVKSCSDRPHELLQNCTRANETIHCLSDEHNNTGIGCFPVAWINKDKCPYYNSYEGRMDEKACSKEDGICPTKLYKSPLSVEYSGCYVRKIEKQTTEGAASEPAVTDYYSGTGNGTNQGTTSCEKYESVNGWMIGFLVTLAVFLLPFTAVVLVMKNKRCQDKRARSSGPEELKRLK